MSELDTVLKPYTSHKKVRAAEITSVSEVKDGMVHLTFAGTLTLPWAEQMFHRYMPVPGDFFLQYDDGYVSVSPRKQFLDGYVREEVRDALLLRIDQAIAQNPADPYPTGELQGLLRDCQSEIHRLRLLAGHTGESFADIKQRLK
jgi:hypothetical protein